MKRNKVRNIVKLILSTIGVAMGVAVIVLSKLKELDSLSAIELLSLGLFSVALSSLMGNNE